MKDKRTAAVLATEDCRILMMTRNYQRNKINDLKCVIEAELLRHEKSYQISTNRSEIFDAVQNTNEVTIVGSAGDKRKGEKKHNISDSIA